MNWRSILLPALFWIAGAAAGFFATWVMTAGQADEAIQNTIAMRWDDVHVENTPFGFYGAQVYLEPASPGYSVRARVWIGRGNREYQDLGELGRVELEDEAIERWSDIEWNTERLSIGPGESHPFLVPRPALAKPR